LPDQGHSHEGMWAPKRGKAREARAPTPFDSAEPDEGPRGPRDHGAHVACGDPNYVENLPFQPFTRTLGDVLRDNFIRPAAEWLLGVRDTSVLAMEGSSAWETALTISFVIESGSILYGASQNTELQRKVDTKIVSVTQWLVNRRIPHDDETFCWDHVTWDTAVVISALLSVLSNYRDRFGQEYLDDIEASIIGGVVWLYRQFAQWELTIKYPGGPADVAQILNTILLLQQRHPNLAAQIENVLAENNENYDLPLLVTQYLLRRRTFRKLKIPGDDGIVETVGCWWDDDYYSSAEVIESLARFHHIAEKRGTASWKDTVNEVRICLIQACTFLESTQADGKWGNQTDTLRVLGSYVMTRRLLPQKAEGRIDSLILPEIHITFKALRWICDEKQVFRDGSFLHSLFLTIFYVLTLAEIYRSWDSCRDTVDKVYDDVLWASPTRTTSERIRRLSADISNDRLRDEVEAAEEKISECQAQSSIYHANARKVAVSVGALLFSILVGFACALSLKTIRMTFHVTDTVAFLTIFGIIITVMATVVGLNWKFDDKVSTRAEPGRQRRRLVGQLTPDTSLRDGRD
jgi:hypothetical protein